MNRRDFLYSLSSVLAASTHSRVGAQGISEFDYVIVGAGSAGCVLANRLSADPTLRVLLLEAGGPTTQEPAVAAPGRWVSLIGSALDWGHSTEAEPGLGGRSLRWPRGRAFGGSSAINAMAYVRGHQRSYDEWARIAGARWSYQSVLPIFKTLEDNSRGVSAFLGAGGPLAVSDTNDPHAGHLAFLEAAREHGYDASPTFDFNGARQENGAGFYQKNIRGARRHSAADAFLSPVLSRPNLTVWPNATARRLLFTKNRASGVEVTRDGKAQQVRVAREVVLAAGVIESPKILMLSGVGPADLLKRHGITVVADSRQVGANLHDHPRVSVRWASRKPLPASSVSAGLFVFSGSTRREGGTSLSAEALAKAAVPPNRGGAEAPPSSTNGTPDLQFYVGRGLDTVDEFITLTVALSQPRSRGAIELRSADPAAAPIIRAGYFSEPSDLERLLEGVRLAQSLAHAKAYDGLRGAPADPAADVGTPDELRAFLRRAADTIFHPVGTCRMGSDAQSVVDGELNVRGVEGVRVADGSVMPVTVNSQTHAACLLIGEQAARFIRGQ